MTLLVCHCKRSQPPARLRGRPDERMAKEPKSTADTPAKVSGNSSRTVARADETELRDWHRRNRQMFDAFGVQLAQVIKAALREVGVQFQEVFSRTKGEESFLE